MLKILTVAYLIMLPHLSIASDLFSDLLTAKENARSFWSEQLGENYKELNFFEITKISNLRKLLALPPTPIEIGAYFGGGIFIGAEFYLAVLDKYGPSTGHAIVYHEFGHHIQALLGLKGGELGADCLAGFILKEKLDDKVIKFFTEIGDNSHGTGEQRATALIRGSRIQDYKSCENPLE